MGKLNTYNLTYCKENEEEKSERVTYILDTRRTEFTQQAFTHASGIFYGMFSMQVSKSAWWW